MEEVLLLCDLPKKPRMEMTIAAVAVRRSAQTGACESEVVASVVNISVVKRKMK